MKTHSSADEIIHVNYQPPGGGGGGGGGKPPKRDPDDPQTFTDPSEEEGEPGEGEGDDDDETMDGDPSDSGKPKDPKDGEDPTDPSDGGDPSDGEDPADGEDGEPGKESKDGKPKDGKPKDGKKGEPKDGKPKDGKKGEPKDGKEVPKLTPKEIADLKKAADEKAETGTAKASSESKSSVDRATKYEGGLEESGMRPPTIWYPEPDIKEGNRMKQMGEKWYGPAMGRLQVLLQERNSSKSYRDRTSGRLDLGRIYREELTINGEPPKVFRRDEPGCKIDTAVSIMVDQSGSMGEGPGSRTEVATALMAGMGAMLERLKIPSEIIGYSGADDAYRGHKVSQNVRWCIYKSFEEPHFQVGRCLPSCGSGNGDYDTMKKFLPRLMGRPEPKKIFFVMIDGGMTNGPGHPTTAVKRIFDFARKKGVRVFGFGMGMDLSELLGDQWVLVPDGKPGNFAQELVQKLTKLLVA